MTGDTKRCLQPTMATRRPTTRERWWLFGILTVLCLDALVCLLPWQPAFPGVALDNSWARVVQEATAHHWAFGRDIAFTYGPWNCVILSNLYHPLLYREGMLASALLVVLLVVSTWQIGLAASQRRRNAVIAASLLCLAVTGQVIENAAVMFYLLLWYLPAYYTMVRVSAVGATSRADPSVTSELSVATGLFWSSPAALLIHQQLLIAAAAFLSLAKFSLAGAAILLIPVLALKIAVQDRRIPWILPIYCLEVLAFWLLAGQKAADIVPYFLNSMELSRGYMTAMQLPDKMLLLAWYTAIAGGVVFLLCRRQWQLKKWHGVLSALPFVVILWMAAKVSFVRCDAHWELALFFLQAVCLTSCAMLWPTGIDRRTKSILKGLTIAAFAGIFLFSSTPRWFNKMMWHRSGQLRGVFQTLAYGTAPMQKKCDAANAAVREQYPIPHVDGTMDLYPTSQLVLLAHQAHYNPRPIIQSYSAYTPQLAEMNAAHLRQASSPDCILFSVEPIDERFPSLDDGLSWPELLTRYEIDPMTLAPALANFLILKRSERPRSYAMQPISECEGAVLEPIKTPSAAEGPIWVEMDIEPTLLSRLCTAALKGPCAYLDVRLGNGKEEQYRLIPEMARAGFLLSPVVSDATTFGWLASTPWSDPSWRRFVAANSVQTLAVDVVARDVKPAAENSIKGKLKAVRRDLTAKWTFKNPIKLRFFRLEFPIVQGKPGGFGPQQLALWQLKNHASGPKTPFFYWIHGHGGALAAPRGTSLRLPVSSLDRPTPKATKQLRVRFGGLLLGVKKGKQEPAAFSISAVDAHGESREIWKKTIDAGPAGEEAIVHESVIPIDLRQTESLVFETLPETGKSVLPFWLGVLCE